MEKHLPHYRLIDIQAQMSGVEAMNLTESSRIDIRTAGMTKSEALEVLLKLGRKDFFKSMTTHADHRVWQDVYHAEWREKLREVSAGG